MGLFLYAIGQDRNHDFAPDSRACRLVKELLPEDPEALAVHLGQGCKLLIDRGFYGYLPDPELPTFSGSPVALWVGKESSKLCVEWCQCNQACLSRAVIRMSGDFCPTARPGAHKHGFCGL